MHQQKVMSEASLTNMSKTEKCAYFHHIFANNFFGTFLKNCFNGFEISVKFCIYLYPYCIFEEIFFGTY
jgi:hypothetical protein